MQVRGAKKQQSSVVYRSRLNSWTLLTEVEDEDEVLAEEDVAATKELAEEVAEDSPDRIPLTRRQSCQRCNGSCR